MMKLRRLITITAALTLGHLCSLGSSTALASQTNTISETPQGVTIPAQRMASLPLSYLKSKLSPHGWGVDRDTAGNLLLYPAATSVNPINSAIASLEPKSIKKPTPAMLKNLTSENTKSLESAPPSQGQNMELNVAESGLLHSDPAAITPNKVDIAALEAKHTDKNLIRRFSNKEFNSAEVQQWRASLQPRGWGVKSDSSGNLLLFPGGAAIEARSRTDLATIEFPKPIDRNITGYGPMAIQQLKAELVLHAWRVKAGKHGVLLFPKVG